MAQVIPLSLGDSHAGYRIVGTTPDYLAHYGATLDQGQPWQAPDGSRAGRHGGAPVWSDGAGRRTVGGRPVCGQPRPGSGRARARRPALPRVGRAGALRLRARPAHPHRDRVGVAGARSATATDKDDLQETPAASREVTVALLRYRTPWPPSRCRAINAGTALQAAAPAIEVTRLLRLLGVGADVLRAMGGVLLAVAALSVFIVLWNAVRERRADIAMLRMLGRRP